MFHSFFFNKEGIVNSKALEISVQETKHENAGILQCDLIFHLPLHGSIDFMEPTFLLIDFI